LKCGAVIAPFQLHHCHVAFHHETITHGRDANLQSVRALLATPAALQKPLFGQGLHRLMNCESLGGQIVFTSKFITQNPRQLVLTVCSDEAAQKMGQRAVAGANSGSRILRIEMLVWDLWFIILAGDAVLQDQRSLSLFGVPASPIYLRDCTDQVAIAGCDTSRAFQHRFFRRFRSTSVKLA
jgi:hypothetical protein